MPATTRTTVRKTVKPNQLKTLITFWQEPLKFSLFIFIRKVCCLAHFTYYFRFAVAAMAEWLVLTLWPLVRGFLGFFDTIGVLWIVPRAVPICTQHRQLSHFTLPLSAVVAAPA